VYLIPFNLVASVLMLIALHGSSILKIIPILSVNFLIAKYCGASKLGPLSSWTFNVAILFLNDHYSGYSFGDLTPSLAHLVRFSSGGLFSTDGTTGHVPRDISPLAHHL
jgi:hypothetical protein